MAIPELGGLVKMSEVLGAFVDPYLDFVDSEENLRKLIAIASLAWNAALLPEEERWEMVKDMLESLPEDVREDGLRIVEELISRKEQYFSEYKQMIVNFELEDIGDELRLTVVSALPGRGSWG